MKARELVCTLEQDAPAAGCLVEEALRPKTPRERWMILMKYIREQCPHGIMYGVNVADGIIVSCENMQQCLSFEACPAPKDNAQPEFDAHWQALEGVCRRMGNGQLAELQFIDGRPVRAKTTPRGRRFRYFTDEQ
jgi:hypothetical protein